MPRSRPIGALLRALPRRVLATRGASGPPSATVHDRAVRDDIRARILAAWLSALPEVDSGFATCLRESMYTVAFRPPPGRGSLRVRYPFIFRPEDSGAGR